MPKRVSAPVGKVGPSAGRRHQHQSGQPDCKGAQFRGGAGIHQQAGNAYGSQNKRRRSGQAPAGPVGQGEIAAHQEFQDDRIAPEHQLGLLDIECEARHHRRGEEERQSRDRPLDRQEHHTRQSDVEQHFVVQGPAQRQQRADFRHGRPDAPFRDEQVRADDVLGRTDRNGEQMRQEQPHGQHDRRQRPVERHDADQSPAEEMPGRPRFGEVCAGDVDHDEAGDHEEDVDAEGPVDVGGGRLGAPARRDDAGIMQGMTDDDGDRGECAADLQIGKQGSRGRRPALRRVPVT
jgi:hypothetical protein